MYIGFSSTSTNPKIKDYFNLDTSEYNQSPNIPIVNSYNIRIGDNSDEYYYILPKQIPHYYIYNPPIGQYRTFNDSYDGNHENSLLFSHQGWSVRDNNSSYTNYLTITIPSPTFVVGILTQGRKNSDQWVKTYIVSYNNMSAQTMYVTDSDSFNITFTANTDRSSVVLNKFTNPIYTDEITIHLGNYHGHQTMRAGLLLRDT